MTGKVTLIFEGKGTCPHCHKRIEILIERETITPAEKAETETRPKLSEDTQTELRQ